ARVLQRANKISIDPSYISGAQPIKFPTEDGRTAHGFFYPPKNRDFTAPENEKPPLLVKSHGGPTSAAIAVLSLTIQDWTSRGFAILDANYGGSTGHGRAHRERLNAKWGMVAGEHWLNAAKLPAALGDVAGSPL